MAETTKATIKSIGDAFVITAGFKYETVKKLIEYGKEKALTLVDQETKEPYFAVTLGKVANASRFGITFTGANEAGYAEATGMFPKASMKKEEKEKFLVSHYAFVVTRLNEVQAQVEAAEKELNKLISTANASITVE